MAQRMKSPKNGTVNRTLKTRVNTANISVGIYDELEC